MGDDVRCITCGQPNRELARFCSKCGSFLEVSSQQGSAEADPVTAAEPAARARNRARSTHEAARGAGRGSSRRRSPVVIPLAVAVLTGALALAGWQTGWPSIVFGVKHVAATERLPIRSPVRSGTPLARQTAPSGASTSSSTPSPSRSGLPAASQPGGPAATVQAYFAAISSKDYAKAWQLGGSNFSTSYTAYVGDFSGTAVDTVTILSVSGSVVTARLVAQQTDGTVKTFQGTYTVSGGAIVKADVQQIS